MLLARTDVSDSTTGSCLSTIEEIESVFTTRNGFKIHKFNFAGNVQ